MRKWINEVPNDGLIYYNYVFNSERLLITSPKALGEVLVEKNYEFIKPEGIRAGIAGILGVGLLLAEGEEHKVRDLFASLGFVANEGIDPTQKSYASIRLPSYQRLVSSLLVQVS